MRKIIVTLFVGMFLINFSVFAGVRILDCANSENFGAHAVAGGVLVLNCVDTYDKGNYDVSVNLIGATLDFQASSFFSKLKIYDPDAESEYVKIRGTYFGVKAGAGAFIGGNCAAAMDFRTKKIVTFVDVSICHLGANVGFTSIEIN